MPREGQHPVVRTTTSLAGDQIDGRQRLPGFEDLLRCCFGTTTSVNSRCSLKRTAPGRGDRPLTNDLSGGNPAGQRTPAGATARAGAALRGATEPMNGSYDVLPPHAAALSTKNAQRHPRSRQAPPGPERSPGSYSIGNGIRPQREVHGPSVPATESNRPHDIDARGRELLRQGRSVQLLDVVAASSGRTPPGARASPSPVT